MLHSSPIGNWPEIAVELMMTDTDLALLSISYIFAFDDKSSVAWILRNARQTYESVRERRNTVKLSESEALFLDGKMERLRNRLQFLGETL